jgi:hypothetical protein
VWLLPVVAGAIVPHAPLLLPELESPEVAVAAERVRRAVVDLELPDVDAVIVISPHARRTGLYHSGSGSLAPMGRPDIEITVDTADELIHEAARVSGLPLLDDDLDHGIVVPLRLRDWGAPVAGIGIGEDDVRPGTLTQVTAALESMVAARVIIVVSINTSAGLLPRAPLTSLPGAEDSENRLRDLLTTDVGSLSTRALSIAQQGGSCAAGPLTVFGRVCDGERMSVVAHEAPVGVGYLVARTT